LGNLTFFLSRESLLEIITDSILHWYLTKVTTFEQLLKVSSCIVCLGILGDLAKMSFRRFGTPQDQGYSYVMEFAVHDSNLPFSKFWESAMKQELFEGP